jgi:SAM-dependent methyltransferase
MQQHTYAIMFEEESKHWWYVGRRRILEQFVRDALPSTGASPRILDVGCGTGANLELLTRHGAAQGLDASAQALAFCRDRGLTRVCRGVLESLPYRDASFQLVTALDVIEHLDDDLSALREMHRVLAPGGRALVFVPAFMFLWGRQDEVSEHRRRYRLPQLLARAREAGFEVERATYANFALFAPIWAARRVIRTLGLKPPSENSVNIDALNGVLGQLFGAERWWLKRRSFPFGVSIIAVLRRAPAA